MGRHRFKRGIKEDHVLVWGQESPVIASDIIDVDIKDTIGASQKEAAVGRKKCPLLCEKTLDVDIDEPDRFPCPRCYKRDLKLQGYIPVPV